jgi:hypothetical protein
MLILKGMKEVHLNLNIIRWKILGNFLWKEPEK